VAIYNKLDEEQRWVGLRLERETWVNLNASRIDPWPCKNTYHQGGGDSIRGA